MTMLTPIEPARVRADGWLPDKQRMFLEGIARGLTVEQACRLVGMSPSSAYAFRQRAAGAAFALGWHAANLRARECLADTLLARAIDGQVETVTRPDGSTVERHRYDNRLAVTMLARLDRQAEDVTAPTHHAARLVAQDFEAFCDQLARDDAPARAGLFVGLRAAQEPAADLTAMVQLARADRFRRTGASLAEEVDVSDLDPANRATWTAEQWLRAEAAGLLALAPAPAPVPEDVDDAPGSPCSPLSADAAGDADTDEADDPDTDDDGEEEYIPVWEEDDDVWMTSYPPPPHFAGEEDGVPGDADYRRELSPEEAFIVKAVRDRDRAPRARALMEERDRWFAAAARRLVTPGEPFDPAALDEAAARFAAEQAALEDWSDPALWPAAPHPDWAPADAAPLDAADGAELAVAEAAPDGGGRAAPCIRLLAAP